MILAIIKSSIILSIAFCVARILRRQSAAVRHMVWSAGLLAALTVPFLTLLLPSWHLARNIQNQAEIVLDTLNAGVKPAATSVLTTDQRPEGRPAASHVLLTIWLAGSAIAGIFLIGCGLRFAWIVIRGKPVTSERWLATAADVSHALRLHRPVRLLQQSELSVLGTWGILRGRILIPRDAESWCDERVRVVLSHEIAHIKRFDWLVQVVAEIARAIYWFNPLFWLACRQLRQESEHACDDAVLNLGIDGQTYASHLLELARSLKNSDRAWSPVLAMAQPPHLERRFVAMLNPSLNRCAASKGNVVVVILFALSLTLPVAAMHASAVNAVSPRLTSVPNAAAAAAVKRATAEDALDRLSRVYWFTIEFGVVREDGALKAYGTGLLSSAGELEAMHQAKLNPLDLETASRHEYDPTHFQPVLFCADSFQLMYDSLHQFLVAW